MTHYGEPDNPLRPYTRIRRPPVVESFSDTKTVPVSAASAPNGAAPRTVNPAYNGSPAIYTAKARDILPDIDYKDYIAEPSPSVVQSAKDLVDELLWKYTSVLMAQPFEVARTILQVRCQDGLYGPPASAIAVTQHEPSRPPRRRTRTVYDDFPDSGDSDGDEPSFFAPATPISQTGSSGHLDPMLSPPETPREQAKVTLPPHQLNLCMPDSILEVISQLWSKEGAWGVWKGSNAAFIYSVLQSLMENWSRSLLSALFKVPDLGMKDDVERLIDIATPNPWASILVAAAASVMTGLILSPLDLVRTRLVITTINNSSRRTIATLRKLPSVFCSPSLIVPTVLHSLIHPVLTLTTPLVLRSHFMIDQDVSPATFSLAKFCSSTAALFVKLPLETVLRRGQVALLSSPEYVGALEAPPPPSSKYAATDSANHNVPTFLETVVPPGKFDGVFSTMYSIVAEEGSRPITPAASSKTAVGPSARRDSAPRARGASQARETVYLRGQGIEGLWRGWKISWWGLVGLWVSSVLGGGGDGEF